MHNSLLITDMRTFILLLVVVALFQRIPSTVATEEETQETGEELAEENEEETGEEVEPEAGGKFHKFDLKIINFLKL